MIGSCRRGAWACRPPRRHAAESTRRPPRRCQPAPRSPNASSRNRDGASGRTGGSASAGRASTRRTPAGAPPRAPAPAPPRRRSTGARGTRRPSTRTWSHSRPLVPCAVARVSGASSRRSVASRCRRARSRRGGRRGSGTAPPSRASRPPGRPRVGPSAGRRRPIEAPPPQRPSRRSAEPAERGSGAGPTGPRRPRSSRPSMPVVLDRQRQVRRPERDAEVERGDDRRQQLAVGPREDRARVDASSGQVRIARGTRTWSSAASGARTTGPSAGAAAGSASRTARGCARRAGPRARRPAAGTDSWSRGRPAAGPGSAAARPRTRRTSASRQP